MEYKNISSKFTLQTQTKYKNTKIQTALDIFFQSYIVFSNIYHPSVLLPKLRN